MLMLLPMEMQLPRMEKIQLPLMEMIQLPLMEKIQLPLMETIQLPRMAKIQRRLMEMIQLPRMEKIQLEKNLQRVNPLMLVTMPRVQMVLTVMQKHRLKNLQGELEEVKVGMMTYQQRLRKQKRVKRSLTRLLQS